MSRLKSQSKDHRQDPVHAHQTIAVIDLAATIFCSPAGAQIDNAMRRFRGLSLLEWTVRRLSESTLLDQTVITGFPSYLNEIAEGSLCGARWMPSLQDDSVVRIHDVAQRMNATWIVTVKPVCPFLDPSLLDRLISSAWARPEADFLSYVSTQKANKDLGGLGLVCELTTRHCLNQIVTRKLSNGRDVVDVVRSHPNRFQMSSIPLPSALDQPGLRFSLESADDWEKASFYLDATGDDPSWQRLSELAAMNVLGQAS